MQQKLDAVQENALDTNVRRTLAFLDTVSKEY